MKNLLLGGLVLALPLVASEPRTISIGRLQYGGGGDWYANPSSIPNLLSAIGIHTAVAVADRETVVSLTGPELWETPYLHMTGHGNVSFSNEEIVMLRRFVRNGGFLHADDNYGMDTSFRREMVRVFPDDPLVTVPLDHPVYNIVFEFEDGLPKIHEHDGEPAEGLGIFVGGRLAVFYSYQSDLGDGWEDANVHGDPADLRDAALRMGVNLFVYALTALNDRKR
ncbi:MAG: DUF4159 domain-containing protein [Gemmatimonadetes bacterium]|nr:DUF4159 domain-containing protein [Gemmatimonadota bacterium]